MLITTKRRQVMETKLTMDTDTSVRRQKYRALRSLDSIKQNMSLTESTVYLCRIGYLLDWFYCTSAYWAAESGWTGTRGINFDARNPIQPLSWIISLNSVFIIAMLQFLVPGIIIICWFCMQANVCLLLKNQLKEVKTVISKHCC